LGRVLRKTRHGRDGRCWIDGEGIDGLVDLIETRLPKARVVLALDLDLADGAGASWLYRNVEVLDKTGHR